LGIPGAVNTRLGAVTAPSNLPGWGGFPFCEAISSALGAPAYMFNDASAAAYGEYWVGVGRGFRSMVLLTLGTGLGGGAIIDGRPLEGEHGLGAEVGHGVIDYNENAALCPCGHRGHLEAYVGARAVVRRAEDALALGRTSSLSGRVSGGEPLTPALVAAEAEAGDALAEEIVLETGRLLGVGVVNVIHAFDPGIVSLGGAMTFGGAKSDLGRRFLDATRREVRRRALEPLADVAIEFASLGSDAGFIGAAGLARAALLVDET
jgi:glucokinase